MRSSCAVGLTLATALLIVACGSDSGSGTTAGIDRGGITIAQGPITGFGSVIVNGVRYATSGASIIVDGAPATEADLAIGQVVRVEGSVDANGTTGAATTIIFDDDVEGPVQSIDLATGRVVVLGQPVQTSTGTSFDDGITPRSLEGLAVGDHVEVSGLVGADGVINATRIERRASAGSLEVKGLVSELDTANQRFVINLLEVDYSAAQLDGFSSGAPANGDLVEVHGSLDSGGSLVATRVEREDRGLGGSDDDDADLEGLVTRFASATDFDVAGQPVTTNAATEFRDGTAADLQLGTNIEVEGGFDAGGRVIAEKIEFRRDSEIRIEATVEATDAAARTLVVLGATVRATDTTRFDDHSDADLDTFGIGDIRVGDFVEVRAFSDGTALVATRIERDDAEAEVELDGPAMDVAQPTFRIAGITVTTDAQTEFRDTNGAAIDAAEFFAAADGVEVKVRGTLVGDAVLADEAELED